MKRISISLALTALFLSALTSCTKAEKLMEEAKVVFYAFTPKDTLTKSYIDSGLNVLWTADDRLSVFRGPANEQYRYTEESGQDEGTFEKVSGDAPSSFYSHNYGIYPYDAGNSSTAEGAISITLPATQSYAANSFGPGDNTMAAVTATAADNIFKFKNVCGYLLLKVYGGDIIRRIVFRGNNGEKIAGAATLTASYRETPTVAMTNTSTTEITLDCGDDGVATGATEDVCTNFWIVVPPTTFTGGFTVEITNTDDQTVTKSTSKSMSITRNVIQPMAAIKVDKQADNDLLTFSLSDGTNTYEAFDISNGYVNVQVPNGTDMTKMTATFTHNGASVKVGDTPQTSGEGTHDFSDFVNPPTCVVTSKSGVENSYIIRMFDLPIVIATTPGGKAITSKEVWTEGCSFVIRETNGTVTDYGSTSLKGRGNSSWLQDKKPYAVKFSEKKEVLGMLEHKRWCLLSNCRGYFFGNLMGYEMGRRAVDIQWSPSGKYVELILNGDFKGCYLLTEQIKIDKNRLDITEIQPADIDGDAVTGGYLLTYDNTWDEQYKFHSQYYNMPVMFKSPDEDIPNQQIEYVKNYINTFENSLYDDTKFIHREWLDYVEINSLIDVYLVWEIAGRGEAGYTDFATPRSVYYYKDRNDVLRAGPVWDFDTYLFYDQNIVYNKCQYYGRLFQDSYFKARVKEKWPIFRANLEGAGGKKPMLNYLDSLYAVVEKAAQRDRVMWPWSSYGASRPASEQYTIIKNGFTAKLDFLESYINSLTVDYDDKSGGNEDYDGQEDQSGNFNFGTN